MSMNKLIVDMNMDLEVIDLCEDEMSGVNMKDGTVYNSLEQNDTEANNGERENLMTNKNAPEINWDLLEMESDHEQVRSQTESQESDSSILLLKVGSGPLPFSGRDEDMNMTEDDSLVLDMEEKKGNDNMNSLSQSIVVSSNESGVGLENMMPQLTLFNELTNENREGLNDSKDRDSMGSEFQCVQVVDKNGKLEVDKTQRVNLDFGIGNDSYPAIEGSSVTVEKKYESEKSEQLVLSSEYKLSDIDYMEGLDENSDSGNHADIKGSSSIDIVSSIESKDLLETIHLGSILPEKNVTGDENVERSYGNVDSVLRESVTSEALIKDGGAKDKGGEVGHEKLNLEEGNANNSAVGGDSDMNGGAVSSIESKDCLEKMGLGSISPEKDMTGDENAECAYANMDCALKGSANSEVLLKDGEAKGTADKVDHGMLNLEGGNANSSGVGGDSDMNDLEDTSVRDTPVGAGQGAEMNRGQTDLGPTLRSLVDNNPPKRRGRPRKEKNMNDANIDLALVVYNSGESLSSRGKRERRESKYLKKPYIINEGSLKRPRKEGKKVKNAGDDKAERSSEEVVLDLIAAAQGLLNSDNSILTKPTRGLVISFRNSLSSKDRVKVSQEVAVALSPVLLDARGKLEDIIMSLNASDLESKESLIGDARGLLEKFNLALDQ